MGRKNLQMCRNRFHCSICKASYSMEWARDNHQKLHKEKVASEEKKE